MLGAAVGAAVRLFLPPAAWTIGLGVLIAMFLSHLVNLPAAAKLAGYVCGIVVIGHSDGAWFFGFYRLIETILGIGMSVLVSFVPKLIPGDEATPQKS